MIYNDFQGLKLSALGMGGMRFPVRADDHCAIDMEALRQMIAYAMEKGVNYFDTAWPYHGGNSEKALGEILQDYPRDRYYLASKFPGFDASLLGRVREVFETQLARCRVDHFDFYLFHNVCELNLDAYLDPRYGILDYLLAQKKSGRIRHLGFSTHGSLETVTRFLDAYGEHMEFCQIQLNWLDYTMQNAKAKVELLEQRHIPVWVMEPVRGGGLVSVAPPFETMLKTFRPEATVVEWAFRFLQSFPGVVVTLSGMSDLQQLKNNIATFETRQPLNREEMEGLLSVARAMMAERTIPCTACRYCVDHCPKGLDIPRMIELYNEHTYSDGGFLAPMAISAMPEEKRPDACIGCRSCEKVCPQTIQISEMMRDFAQRLKRS